MRMMLALPLALLLGVGAAGAQTSQTTETTQSQGSESGNAAVNAPASNPAGMPMSALESGSNSFSEDQARSRIEDAGFSNVSGLAKNEQGIWQAKADHQGRQVTVGLDYKGNIGMQ